MKAPTPSARQQGTALTTALITTILLFGIATSYMTLSAGGIETAAREKATVEARISAEDGIQLAAAELKSGVDTDGNGVGNITKTEADGRVITVTCTSLGGNLYKLHSKAVLRRARTAVDVLAEKVPGGVLSYNARAAIAANGPVSTLGNISIDGRDWNITGTAIVGSGVYGISSTGTISNGGSSTVGGKGWAPSSPPHAGTEEPLSTWTNGINEDGDGATDEEFWDGIDNDGDGKIDEDTKGFPTTPDVMFGFTTGTLKAAAISAGTYYASQSAFDAAVAANGDQVPGGKIIYLDFDTWQPAQLGGTLNSTPSVIIQHNSTGTRLLKNAHGMFKGLMIVDGVTHLNGDFTLLGALISYTPGAPGNTYGNGNAIVKYCSAALASLPATGANSSVRIKAWDRSGAQ